MRNEGQRPQGSGRNNGFMRSFSSYLRIVSNGASNVASTVKSAGVSVASSLADRDEDAARDQAVDFKNHILRFSGFSWHESDDKQRAKVKERLDKFVKDALLDLCDLLDISVSKANTRKEDIIGKLVAFLAAPHATTDVLLAEKEQLSPKSRKRKRASASKSTEDVVVKRSRKVLVSPVNGILVHHMDLLRPLQGVWSYNLHEIAFSPVASSSAI